MNFFKFHADKITSLSRWHSAFNKRNITWYNPLFGQNVPTNIGKTFLKILDEEFSAGHILHKIFNSNIKHNIDGQNNWTNKRIDCDFLGNYNQVNHK